MDNETKKALEAILTDIDDIEKQLRKIDFIPHTLPQGDRWTFNKAYVTIKTRCDAIHNLIVILLSPKVT